MESRKHNALQHNCTDHNLAMQIGKTRRRNENITTKAAKIRGFCGDVNCADSEN